MDSRFNVTEQAVKRVTFLLEDEPVGSRLRITVLGGGCSGFQYKYVFDTTQGDDDLLLAGGAVIIDEMSLSLIEGSTLDYVEDLGSAGFEIRNPNATARCGCGNSFSI